jgi:hypothetical protein
LTSCVGSEHFLPEDKRRIKLLLAANHQGVVPSRVGVAADFCCYSRVGGYSAMA